MNEPFCTIADAAKILKVEEHNILDIGSRGKLSIYANCYIFNLFYLKVPTNPDDIEDFPNESEITPPWDENARLPKTEYMQLSTICLKRYCAGDLETELIIKPEIEDQYSIILFGLYDIDGNRLKLKDVNLRVRANDILTIQTKLKARKELKDSNPDIIDKKIADSKIDSTEPTKNTFALIEKNDKKRKKVMPMQRETSLGLLLIHDLIDYYKITYLDELKGLDAWGKIFSKEYKHESVKTVTNKYIVFNDETKLEKTDFLEKYRKRFKLEN